MSVRSFLRPLTLGYFFVLILLLLYSFSQIDLGLTLTRFPAWQGIQKSFQYIGYFNRPLSTMFFIGIVVLLNSYYWYFLWRAKKGKLTRQQLWILTFGAAGILLFSYNAFSHDLFNYIFDAKIATYYGQNPYEHKALDYPQDPMLGFMHWTHRTYPYGPIWLALTIPLSYLGFHLLLPTVLLFKTLMMLSYLGCVYIIGRTTRTIAPQKEVAAMTFFALNPLVLVESLVSSHLDVVMLCVALYAVVLLIEKKYVLSTLSLLLSIGIKFATVFLLPVWLYIVFRLHKKILLSWTAVADICVVAMIPAVLVATVRTNFQPWYLLSLLAFVPLSMRNIFVLPSLVVTFFSLFHYVPYLFLGNWDPPVPYILVQLQVTAVVVSILVPGIAALRKK